MRKFMAFCLLVSFFAFPVNATDTEYVSRDTFWNWAAGSNGVIKQVINFFGGLGTCSKSEDTYHHASSYFKEGNVGGEVRYRCICDLCGDSFTAYEKDLQQSYDAQVAELPATGYDSSGSLIWSLLPLYFKIRHSGSYIYDHYYSDGDLSFSNSAFTLRFNCASSFIQLAPPSEGSSINVDSITLYYSGVAPVDGYYSLVACESGSIYGVYKEGESYSDLDFWDKRSPVYYSVGDSIQLSFLHGIPRNELRFCACQAFAPVYKVTPLDSLVGEINTIYNIQSRPTSITGDYGIIGDNGQIIKVEGNTIVNETNNTVYNPVTGETKTMSDWSYNYEDRSYTVTTETGDTVTITYGDENVVIKEGDTTYNVYYLVDGSGSENPGPEVCDHTWTETGRTEPTCTTAGKVTSTCSKCNQTKTETIPATGHSWVVDRTVQTTYDEEGNLLQQGYTIYSCSVCGEQYKDMEGTGPPGGEDEKSIWEKIGDFFGTIGGGFIDIIGAVLGKLLDALTKLAEMLMGKLKIVVETVLSIFDEVPALFGGFLDFLGAIFPFLPPEITTILTFGVIAVVFIGILKAVRR